VTNHVARVREELARYEHLVLEFDVEPDGDGAVLVIGLKQRHDGARAYRAAIHPRDIEHAQFAWTFQRFLYDCIHDYMAELFTRNPQQRGGTQ
jgi:hypothetical protein